MKNPYLVEASWKVGFYICSLDILLVGVEAFEKGNSVCP
jgi:hypothetical protein